MKITEERETDKKEPAAGGIRQERELGGIQRRREGGGCAREISGDLGSGGWSIGADHYKYGTTCMTDGVSVKKGGYDKKEAMK